MTIEKMKWEERCKDRGREKRTEGNRRERRRGEKIKEAKKSK